MNKRDPIIPLPPPKTFVSSGLLSGLKAATPLPLYFLASIIACQKKMQ